MTREELLTIDSVRDYLLDPQRLDEVDEIAQKNRLPLERADELLRLADAVMFGELEASKMPSLVATAFGVDAGAAQQVAIDVIGFRLLPLAEFIPGIEAQFADWGGEAKEYPDVHIVRPRYTIEKAILDYAQQVGLELDEPIMKRFVYLAKGYLLKERAKDATVTLMHRPVNIGGLGLTSELAEKVLQHLDGVDLSKVEDLPTHEEKEGGEMEEKNQQEKEEGTKGEGARDPSAALRIANESSSGKSESHDGELRVAKEEVVVARDPSAALRIANEEQKDPLPVDETQGVLSPPKGDELEIDDTKQDGETDSSAPLRMRKTENTTPVAKAPVAEPPVVNVKEPSKKKVVTKIDQAPSPSMQAIATVVPTIAGELIDHEAQEEGAVDANETNLEEQGDPSAALRIAKEEQEDPSPVDETQGVLSPPKGDELEIASDEGEDPSAVLRIADDEKESQGEAIEDSSAVLRITKEKKPVQKESPKVAPTAAIMPVATQAMATVVPTIAGELITQQEQEEVAAHEKALAVLPSTDFEKTCEDQCRQVVNKLKPLLRETNVTQKMIRSLVASVLRGRLESDRAFVQLAQSGVEAARAHQVVQMLQEGYRAVHRASASVITKPAAQPSIEDTAEQQVLDMRHAALTKQMPKESVKPVLPGARVSVSRTPREERRQQRQKIDAEQVKQAQVASRPKPATVQLSEKSVQHVPVKQKKVTDVRFEKKLVGPVEELGTMTLADFRRLSSDPQDAINKLLDTLARLEEIDYEQRIAGVRAWRKSPMSKRYTQMTQEALLSGLSVSEMATQMRSKGEETLTPAEIAAVVSFNAQIAF
jgi:hypothetical protein